MAKIKKRRLRWTASDSAQVVGYKLYWAASGEKVSYESPSEKVGNVTEIILPDGLASFSPPNGPVEFGITAIDELGNESDLITIAAPYQFNAPKAPEKVWIESIDRSVPSTAIQRPESGPSFPPSAPPSGSSAHGSLKAVETPKTDQENRESGIGSGSSPNRQNISLAIRRPENSI